MLSVRLPCCGIEQAIETRARLTETRVCPSCRRKWEIGATVDPMRGVTSLRFREVGTKNVKQTLFD